jgi:hypothetical protein
MEQKEVLYLRHKLQRGLLTRDQQPQESEMEQMSEYVTMLENLKDLEVSIIRGTKINKVLKAMLKLESIPREEEFHFKDRSQVLLDKWNKLLTAESTNGVNGKSEAKPEEKNDDSGKKASEEPKSDTPKASEPKAEKPDEADKSEEEKIEETPQASASEEGRCK